VRALSSVAALVAVAACTALSASPARAQTGQDQAAAEGLFSQGRDLMAAGKLTEACAKFAESQRLDPSAGTLLNLATCYEKDGKVASAWVTFKEAATAAQRADEPERVKLARSKAEALAPSLPMLTVTVPPAADRPDLVVKRDGETVGRAVWGTPIPVDPGVHPVTASAPGFVEWKGEVKVDGPAAKVSIEVPALVAVPAPPVAPPPPAPASTGTPGSTQRVVGVVLGSVGLAGLAAGSVFGLLAKKHLDDSNGHCTGAVCDSTGVSAVSDARSSATVSTIAFIAGGALLAGGVVVYLVAPRSGRSVGLAPGAGPSATGLTLTGSW
jgi:hypothetical protein